ncbi:DUF3883 domain-containing protein [Pedobacter nototheniae]|uniref:DUF3883 domain-containing protein n=1 Tax=Pedobacter nototheniae TaxID=2488994 RepID=UPI00103A9FF0|nr:DUF3883 domain-containing protein [Pedobacter nototheniae]
MSTIRSFINNELKARFELYKTSPDYILEHYEAEQQNIASYNGRQLLEMLQNADDAAKNAKNKKAFIELRGEVLHISNNGDKFDESGFKSLMYIHRSGKKMKPDTIGQKGLGFRSILSWAEHIIVESGGEQVTFSENQAQNFLQRVYDQQPDLKAYLKQESGMDFPIATLRIPEVVEEPLVSKIYDTSIVVKLKKNIQTQVKKQMKERVSMQTMLFLNNLDVIELKCEGYHRIYKRIKTKGKITVFQTNLISGTSSSQSWNILHDKGKHNGKVFELSIAWKDDLKLGEGNIYTYFETQSKFNFPGILHGTFELSPDRNHIIDDPAKNNAFLSGKVAELMIKVARYIALKNEAVDYAPLSFLNADYQHMCDVLKDAGLEEMVLRNAKQSPIFPTVNNNYICAKNGVFYYPHLNERLFYGDDVEDLLLYSEYPEIDDLLENLGVIQYAPEKLYQMVCSRLGKTEKRIYARMLRFLMRSHLKDIAAIHQNKLSFLPLFIDNQGQGVSFTKQLFVQDENRDSFILPENLPFSILDKALHKLLIQVYQENDLSSLNSDLAAMGLKEYSFTEIVSALASHYLKADSPVQVKELHHYLFLLFLEEKRLSNEQLPSKVSLPVLGKKKNIISAHHCYFGRSHGELLSERLYRFDQKRILSSFEDFELNAPAEQLREYFEWLGVANLPRLLVKTLSPDTKAFNDFADHVLRSLDFKKSITNYSIKYRDYHDFMKTMIKVTGIKISAFDDMDQILLKSSPEDILLWIKNSPNLRTVLEENKELYNDARVWVKLQDKLYDRELHQKELPSFVKWQFSNTPWLPAGRSGTRTSPEKCCLSKTITSEFSPFLERPSESLKKNAIKAEINPDQFENYLVNCGVHREIATFSLHTLYGMLLSLPESDISKKAGPSIYREIISNFPESGLDNAHPAYKRFLEEGRVVCELAGKRDYYPVDRAYYLQTKKYANNLLKKFPLVQIDRKRGPKKVNRIFGVEPLAGISFELTGEPKMHEFNSVFISNLNRFKALVYALRMDLDTRGIIKAALKKLRINLVSEINADYIHNGVRNSLDLEEFEFINKKSTFYILFSDQTNPEESDLGIADAVAEILTDIIGTEEYRSFIRELYNTHPLAQENLLIRELQLEDNSRIALAKAELNVVDDIRLSFWRAFLHATGQKFELTDELSLRKMLFGKLKVSSEVAEVFMDPETYAQLTEQNIQKQFFDLFEIYKVKFSVFKKQFPELDFKTLLRNDFQDIKSAYRQSFGSLMFNQLSAQSIEEKIKIFQILARYDRMEYQNAYGFITDMQHFFIKLIKTEFNIRLASQMALFSIDDRIKENMLSLNALNLQIPAQASENYEGQALILFHETEALKAYIATLTDHLTLNSGLKINQSEISFGGEKIIFTDYKSLAEQILAKSNFGRSRIKSATTGSVESKTSTRSGASGKGKRPVKFSSGIEEQVGFIGELLAYYQLKERYSGRENVQINWISENAYRADVSATSEAGKGCDIELIEDGKVRYIEVKAVASVRDGFKITPSEITLAQNYPDKYDLLIVENPLSGDAQFRYIRSAFKFSKGESFMFNTKMKVLNDSYRIRFKWVEDNK